MTAGTAWLKAFPRAQAERAVEALLRGWSDMAGESRPHFGPKTAEPKLTRVVCSYIRSRIAPEMKLLGHWGTEGVENDVDFETGRILDEGRTDIEYAWNGELTQLSLVFEFKKLNGQNTSRRRYLQDGVMRFVSGVYSRKEPTALMVGILGAPRKDAVGGLRRRIERPSDAAAIRACADSSGHFVQWPALFPRYAEFDTEHLRDPEKAPPHGTIRIAHLFVSFPYEAFPDKKRKRRAHVDAEDELST